jgi:hypothetical protein
MAPDHDSPGRPVRFAELDEATRQRARIIVLHDPRPGRCSDLAWSLSLTDITGRPIAHERVHVSTGDTEGLLTTALQFLYTVGMRVAGDWVTSTTAEQTRHYARVAVCSSMN